MTAAPTSGTALTTGTVARKLGVAPTTLRSWERRYGIGPADREQGRHRRWSPADVGRVEEMCRLTALGVPPAEAARAALQESPVTLPRQRRGGDSGNLSLGNVRQECRGLARAAVRLDAPAVETQLTTTVGEYGYTTGWEEVMAPALHAIGRKWASSGERYVEVEHLLSWHVSSSLRLARNMRGTPASTPSGPVLLTCVPGEQHTLPLEALVAVLGERGVATRMFGAALPAEALYEAVRRIGPSAVVLWAHSRNTADRALVRLITEAEWGVRGARTHPAVLVAGPGWSPAAGTYGPGVERLTGLRTAADRIESLFGG
ncbi:MULTISPECIES: MerR family transcriptional regulator [Streptomyces]|uniref:Transcriptional regulator n=1 Tax=Streptomyces venezuelae TaxID=54571 RepID=A0A5P2BIR7_STRVZ|nr:MULTISPECIES: MerR family transcriptional regulator [Streptomyces]NEA01224.1 MerR family transcriptional regulator [Streptomyces sp. SID10116]MYY82361.1 MerR family transcriptional regulator [Streptomyces sp. SID335]MYZ19542.1 MerR family transcriptional regulator [Streptomyces sp. SID337]NDZ91985.1 MerR family transcriptional regulator [Streptomyces sp. SID10115]NEB47645.1 MerR family transcriptional regulator [Streptomyces sp. SID339]